MTTEEVVLLDGDGRAVGTAPKTEVHHADTPLHLAFSLYLFDAVGALLVTRRAPSKRTFPGIWTNSVCGHPAPGETMTDAVERRAQSELGVRVTALRLVVPGFAYRATMNGVVENEMCPVYTGRLGAGEALTPDAHEVAETAWVSWSRLAPEVLQGDRPMSPWSTQQIAALAALGPDPGSWPAADPSLLPPAALATGSSPQERSDSGPRAARLARRSSLEE
jgi:isopentenyl-diphosphate Delta-isomerase